MIDLMIARRIQVGALGASALLGALPGLLFAAGSDIAWQITYATFLWSLIAGLGVVLAAFISQRIAHGDWRSGLILSFVIFFSQTTVYLAVLLMLAALMPTPEADVAFMPVPVLSDMAPTFYGSSAFMVALSGPIYIPWMKPPDR